ncbi:MAG: thiopeptide-type bacteriocin biosynthesis protein [Pseudobdellovibrionaceae bacterium]
MKSKFVADDKIYFRMALQSFEYQLDENELKAWLANPWTRFQLNVGYPDLVRRSQLEGLDNFTQPLRGIHFRSLYSTVPVAGFVAVGSAPRKHGDHAPLLINRIVGYRYQKDTVEKNLLRITEKTLFQVNSVVYSVGNELIFPHTLCQKTVASIEWQILKKTAFFVEIKDYLIEPKTFLQISKRFKKYKLSKKKLESIIREMIKISFVRTSEVQDRFSYGNAKKIFNEKNVQGEVSAKKELLGVEHFHNYGLAVVAEQQNPFYQHSKLTKDIGQASQLMLAMSLQGSGLRPCQSLIERFQKQFDTRSVPLLQVVNSQHGFYDGSQLSSSGQKNYRHLFFQDRIYDSLVKKSEILLSDQEVERYLQSHPLPAQLASFSTGYLLSDEKAWIRKIFAGPGVRPIGRFLRFFKKGTGSSDLLPEVADNFLWAEIGSTPAFRNKDLFSCRLGRGYFIDINNNPKNASQGISLRDLSVVLKNGTLLLWSDQLQKYILPVQSNAVNPLLDPMPVARLLNQIASQFHISDIEFPWLEFGAMSYLPRVRWNSVVLAPQQWTFSKDYLNQMLSKNSTGAEAWLRETFAGVEVLTVNVEQKEYFLPLRDQGVSESILKLSKSKPVLVFRETAGLSRACLFNDKPMRTEFLQLFRQPLKLAAGPEFLRPQIRSPHVFRTLYFTVRASVDGQNVILRQLHKSFCKEKQPWFFIRYNEEGPVLRLRVLCRTSEQYYEYLQKLEHFLRRPSVNNSILSYKIEPYFPEKDVYIGAKNQRMFLLLSWLDSGAVGELLRSLKGDKTQASDLMIAAWISVYFYTKHLNAVKPDSRSGSSFFSEISRDEFYESKEMALKIITEQRALSFKIFQKREHEADKLGLTEQLTKLRGEELEFYVQRLCHLSLNRLGLGVALQYEHMIYRQMVAAHCSRL